MLCYSSLLTDFNWKWLQARYYVLAKKLRYKFCIIMTWHFQDTLKIPISAAGAYKFFIFFTRALKKAGVLIFWKLRNTIIVLYEGLGSKQVFVLNCFKIQPKTFKYHQVTLNNFQITNQNFQIITYFSKKRPLEVLPRRLMDVGALKMLSACSNFYGMYVYKRNQKVFPDIHLKFSHM